MPELYTSAPFVRNAIDQRLRWAHEQIPGFAVVRKRGSRFMLALYYLSAMWIWNREFLDHFVTTIGPVLYVPSKEGRDPEAYFRNVEGLALLKHELQHIEDARRLGPVLWNLGYLFPQILTPLALLGLLWWPLWFLALAALPWPAPFRVWAEARGYDVTLRTYARWGPTDRPGQVETLRRLFTGWAYYRMAWRWEPLRVRFLAVLNERR